MSSIDDLPKRDRNRRLQEQSETAFQAAISECEEFVVQSVDKYDYGTDFQIEAVDAGSMTNVRVHVQLKGTGHQTNADGSVSISIARSNLNYLLMPQSSIFVCCHTPSERLLVRWAEDVVREYEHRGENWITQETVTVRFKDDFDHDFQRILKEYAIASARRGRDRRLDFAAQPPESLSGFLEQAVIDLPVPADRKRAEKMLAALYAGGRDREISQSFDKFRAILGPSNRKLMSAYMAEINLGINGQEFNRSRILDGIKVLSSAVNDRKLSPGSLIYCVGNGWLALGKHEKARDTYYSALELLHKYGETDLAAQCCKNLGAAMEKLKNPDEAHAFYILALKSNPRLAEAHFALALWYSRKNTDLDRAVEHLDAIVWHGNSAGTLSSVLGWRAEIFFKQDKIKEAFRDIHALLSDGDKLVWVWPWCAKLVATYGRTSLDATQNAVHFWDAYLRKFTDDLLAQRERLLCIWRMQSDGGQTVCDYDGFKQEVANIVARGAPDPAFLWDRTGHWAQDENNWPEAEECYRKAFELSPEDYGYCLGTALNSLGRHEEALPILMPQAEEHQPDAMSWFQVALAREGTGDIEGCINAYERALQLDENYDLAWFNLGGIYWNCGKVAEATKTWQEAIRRFPSHPVASRLQQEFGIRQNGCSEPPGC